MEETEQTPVEAKTTEPSADHGVTDEPTRSGKRGGIARLIVWLILLVIVVAAAWFGWRFWQERNAQVESAERADAPLALQPANGLERQQEATSTGEPDGFSVSDGPTAGAADEAEVRAGGARQARLNLLESQIERLRGQLQSMRQQRTDDNRTEQVVRNQLLGLEERMSEVEDAMANVARQRLSARDSMLVGDAEMLLVLGEQRYRLFGDAAAAAEAFALADKSLAALDSQRFLAVRQAIAEERRALASTRPESRQSWLERLHALRGEWQSLPLDKAPEQRPTNADKGAWQRTLDTLSGLVTIRHTGDAPESLAMADAALARQLGALDLASAQAALLAGDVSASRAALARAGDTMAHAFEMSNPAVRALATELAALQRSMPVAAAEVELDAALDKLRDLRAIDAINQTLPAPPASGSAERSPTTLPGASQGSVPAAASSAA